MLVAVNIYSLYILNLCGGEVWVNGKNTTAIGAVEVWVLVCLAYWQPPGSWSWCIARGRCASTVLLAQT